MNRSAGILCPVFSIPANQGIGDLGQKTIRMIDIIADAGYTIWQILPLQMTGPTHSPYQTYSSFAGDPIYINLDRLCEMGLLTQSSIVNCNKFKDFVEYDKIREFKEPYFQKAFKVFKKEFDSFKEDFEAFKHDAFWLEDWSAYSLFKSFYNGAPWFEWEDEYKNWPENRDIDLNDYKLEGVSDKFADLCSPMVAETITTGRLASHFEHHTGHSLAFRRYYRQFDY